MKGDQVKITALVAIYKGSDLIVLNGITGAEYSNDGGETWQDSSAFVGLKAETEYSFVARYKETSALNAGDVSDAFKFTTAAAEKEGCKNSAAAITALFSLLVRWWYLSRKSSNLS